MAGVVRQNPKAAVDEDSWDLLREVGVRVVPCVMHAESQRCHIIVHACFLREEHRAQQSAFTPVPAKEQQARQRTDVKIAGWPRQACQ
jgi:hypothetical protein